MLFFCNKICSLFIIMNPYEILNINENSTLTEIKKAYKILALKYHPDKNTDVDSKEKFMQIKSAYDVLLQSGNNFISEAKIKSHFKKLMGEFWNYI